VHGILPPPRRNRSVSVEGGKTDEAASVAFLFASSDDSRRYQTKGRLCHPSPPRGSVEIYEDAHVFHVRIASIDVPSQFYQGPRRAGRKY